MASLTQPLRDHHKHCDEIFAVAEAAAHDGDWPACDEAFAGFRDELEAHFSTEEQVVFPAFEEATGMTQGPTQVMRIEHAQMRELLGQLDAAVQEKNKPLFAGVAETLLILMQQHNMKEENILYPMCDRSVAEAVDVAGALESRLGAACSA
jgi:iron-sulfur cluster repair protein YtfE (RIC family)